MDFTKAQGGERKGERLGRLKKKKKESAHIDEGLKGEDAGGRVGEKKNYEGRRNNFEKNSAHNDKKSVHDLQVLIYCRVDARDPRDLVNCDGALRIPFFVGKSALDQGYFLVQKPRAAGVHK